MELTKQELRQRYLARLKLNDSERGQASLKISKSLADLLKSAKGPVAAFRALSTEPLLEGLVNSLNLDWVFPRTEGDSLSFYRASWDELKPGAYGIFEPPAEPSRLVPVDMISWALIPGVSFDRLGGRLGRGKGFYDRTLQNFSGHRVGVSLVQGLSNGALPKEEHDLLMDWLVTDRFVLRTVAA